MGRITLALLAAVVGASAGAPARSATLRVERDGSGNFTTIQAAIDAASPGDVIQIGPGRYTEFAPFSPQPGSWIEPTYVGVTKDNLTLRGTDRDGVIIGPATPNFVGFGPKGIVTRAGLTSLRVENVTVENVREGVYLLGGATVRNCVIARCEFGLISFTDLGMLVEGCRFEANARGGLFAVVPAQDVRTVSCEFIDNASIALDYQGFAGGLVDGCEFRGGTVGIQFEQFASGTISNSTFADIANSAVVIALYASGDLQGNSMTGGGQHVFVYNYGHVTGTRNAMLGGSFATVRLAGGATADLHGNDILKGTGLLVRLDAYVLEPYTVHLEDNYWGFTDAAAIAAAILDGNDDPSIHAVVDFEPFSLRTVPAEAMSIGELKARFREDGP